MEQGNSFLRDPEQAWFWSERWQELERKVQDDIDAGRILIFETIDDALFSLGVTSEEREE